MTLIFIGIGEMYVPHFIRFLIYVDRTSKRVRIDSDSRIDAVHIYSISGKTIYAGGSKNEVDISRLHPGHLFRKSEF